MTGPHLENVLSCAPGAPFYKLLSGTQKYSHTSKAYRYLFYLPFHSNTHRACLVRLPPRQGFCCSVILPYDAFPPWWLFICTFSPQNLAKFGDYAATSRQTIGGDLKMMLIDARKIRRRDFVLVAVGVNGLLFEGGSTGHRYNTLYTGISQT
jgi:hypothetical protein